MTPIRATRVFVALVALQVPNGGVSSAHAQPSSEVGAEWEVCQKTPNRACLLARTIQLALHINDDKERARTLARTLEILTRAGLTKDSNATLDHALRVVPSITDERSRVSALAIIMAKIQATTEPNNKVGASLELAKQVARSISDKAFRAEALAHVGMAQAKANQTKASDATLEEAQQLALLINRPGGDLPTLAEQGRSQALGAIAVALATTGKKEQALQVARSITDQASQANVLKQIAWVQVELGLPKEAATILEEESREPTSVAEIASAMLSGRLVRSVRIVNALAMTGKITEALEVAQSVTGHGPRIYALGAIATAQAKAGLLNEAAATRKQALQIALLSDGSQYLPSGFGGGVAFIDVLAEADMNAEALELAQSKAASLGVFVLPQMAELQALAGLTTEATATVEKALQLARANTDEWLRAHVFARICKALARVGRISQALELVQAIDREEQRALGLHSIAVALATTGKVIDALRLAESIKVASSREQILDGIFVVALKARETTEALEVARSFSRESFRDYALRQVAEVLAKAGKGTDALAVSQSITDDAERAVALAAIAANLQN